MIRLLFCLSFCLLATDSQSQWIWQNPFPQGNNIYSVKMFDQNNLIMCGKNGTIVRTTNAGSNWKITRIPSGEYLSSMYFIDSNTGFVVSSSNSEIHKTTDSGETWTLNSSGLASSYERIIFINEQTGYACGGGGIANGVLIRTTNGGSDWNVIHTHTSRFTSVSFPSPDTGYVIGHNQTFFNTTNAGANWTSLNIPISNLCMHFTDVNTGYISGNSNANVYKTTNSGNNWTSQSTSAGGSIEDIFFINQNRGWVTGSTSAYSLTTNGGTNWFHFSTGATSDFHSVHFADPLNGCIVGENGKTLITNNGGFIWENLSRGSVSALNNVWFMNSQTGFAVGWLFTVLKTNDAGATWNSIAYNNFSNITLNSVFFTDQNTGYTVGDTIYSPLRGTLYKTTNGGTNWNRHYRTQNGSRFRDVYFLNRDTGFIVTSSGVLKTTNAGANYQSVSGSFDLNSITFITPQTGYCSGRNGVVIKSTDGGSVWTNVATNTTFDLNDISFADANTGYAVGYPDAICKTTNGGINWTTLSAGTFDFRYYSVKFMNAHSGIVTAGRSPGASKILKTTDGGTTWTTDDFYTTELMLSTFFTDGNTGYISGTNGLIIKTSNGGLTFTGLHESVLPESMRLHQNFPNPFNPKTVISYEIGNANFVSLKVYDMSGKEVTTLVNEMNNAGRHEVEFDATNLPSGVYFYAMRVNGLLAGVKRMVILK